MGTGTRVVPNLRGIWVGYRETDKTYPRSGYGYGVVQSLPTGTRQSSTHRRVRGYCLRVVGCSTCPRVLSTRVRYEAPLSSVSASIISASCRVASCEEHAPTSLVDPAELPESAWLMTAPPPLVALLGNPGYQVVGIAESVRVLNRGRQKTPAEMPCARNMT